ncbi:M20 family metallopeptidase [Paenibacillus sp. y28]|uniref:M20 family metallopeptidase n=1 Tax=Paenibacillus sp. y28 TaxID=3129110 RepID=UPI003017CE7F
MMKDEERLEAKTRIQKAVDARNDELRGLALRIHANPELAFQEHQAVRWLTEPLKEAGFTVETGIAGLATAFKASWSGKAGGPAIALVAEYDALPEIGHACGHNLIGTAAVGAALALKDAFPDLPGTIEVYGSPAEEEGGGKIIMCEQGVFDQVAAAMLCHPREADMVMRGGIACVDAKFKFYGKASHASSSPEAGISALDALVNSYVAINGLRQFFKPDVKIHGVVSNGGIAPNIVPDYCEANFYIRAATVKDLEGVKQKVYTAVEHCSLAVGGRCEIVEGMTYAERMDNKRMADLFKDNLGLMGIQVAAPTENGAVGSSDMGNVGQVTPIIHPYFNIGEVKPHTPEFQAAAGSEAGLAGLNRAAKAMAMTAFDLCADPDALRQVREEFEQWKTRQSI